jgi:hypothetical protein
MPNVFIISDTHFGHNRMYTKLTREDGPPARPVRPVRPEWRQSAAEADADADAYMVEAWNKMVKPDDKVYHLGDVSNSTKVIAAIMPQLNGRKVLIKGNHDGYDLKVFIPHFKDIHGTYELSRESSRSSAVGVSKCMRRAHWVCTSAIGGFIISRKNFREQIAFARVFKGLR